MGKYKYVYTVVAKIIKNTSILPAKKKVLSQLFLSFAEVCQ